MKNVPKLFVVKDVMSARESDVRSLYALMPEDRRIRCDRYRHETDRRLSILAYSLLLYSVYSEYGAIKVRLGYGPDGKPYLADSPDIHFNWSHCNLGIALAISSEPVGVDIESFDRYDEKLTDFVMSAEESASVRNSQNPDQAFIRLWTEKEAFVKYTGKGIADDMKGILEQHKDVHIRTFADCPEGCAISVCSKSDFAKGFTPLCMSADDLCSNLIKELPTYEKMSILAIY